MKDDAGQFHQMVMQNPEVGQKRTINSKRPKKPRVTRFRRVRGRNFVDPHGSSVSRLQGFDPTRRKPGDLIFGGLEISGWKKNPTIFFTWFLFCIFWAIFSGKKSLQIHPFSWQLDDENTRQTGRFLHNLTAAPVGVHPMVRGPTRAEARGGINEQLGWKTAKNLQRAKPVNLNTFFSQLIAPC